MRGRTRSKRAMLQENRTRTDVDYCMHPICSWPITFGTPAPEHRRRSKNYCSHGFPRANRIQICVTSRGDSNGNRLHLSAEHTVMNTKGVTFTTNDELLIRDKQRIRESRDETQEFVTCWSGGKIVALSPCGRWVAARSDTNRRHLRLIDVVARKEIREVAGTKATFAGSGEYVVVWHPNAKLVDYHVYRMGTTVDSSPTRTVRGKKTSLPILSSDGRSIALPDQMFWLEVHRLGQPEPLPLTGAPQYYCATYSPDSQLFVSGHFMGEIRLRFAHDLEQVHVFKSTRNGITAVAFSRDSQQLAAGSSDGTIDLYDVSHFLEAADAGETSHEGNQQSTIETLDAPKPVSSLNAHVNPIRQIVFSHDGSKLVSRDSNGTAKLWNLNGDSARLPSIANSEFPLSSRIQTWWEDTPQGIRLRKHTQKPEHEVSGQLRVGDRVDCY